MKKTMIIMSVLVMTLSACINSQKEDHSTLELISDNAGERLDVFSEINKIVLFENNAFLFYKHQSIDSLLIVWGNTKYETVQYDTLPMFAIGPPLFEWSNDDVICLKQGCGTSCYFAYVLQFETGEIKKYMYPMAYDAINNLIAYSGDNPDVFLLVENFLTGEKREIHENYDHRLGPLSTNAIDSISFLPNGLYLKWKDAESTTREKTLPLRQE